MHSSNLQFKHPNSPIFIQLSFLLLHIVQIQLNKDVEEENE